MHKTTLPTEFSNKLKSLKSKFATIDNLWMLLKDNSNNQNLTSIKEDFQSFYIIKSESSDKFSTESFDKFSSLCQKFFNALVHMKIKDNNINFALAMCYWKEIGVAKNEQLAYNCLENIKNNAVDSLCDFAYYLRIKFDEPKLSLYCYKLAAQKEINNPNKACYFLAKYYLYSLQDHQNAINLFKNLVNNTSSTYIGHAYYELAKIYYSGNKDVPKNLKKSFEFATKSAEQKYVKAYYYLGIFSYKGLKINSQEIVPINYKKSFEYFSKADKLGFSTEALYYLGLHYRYGRGTKNDPNKAFTYFNKHYSNTNFIGSAFELMISYHRGMGISKNNKKALELSHKLINHRVNKEILGITYLVLGKIYEEGIDEFMPKNVIKSCTCYYRSICCGYKLAQTHLDQLHQKTMTDEIWNNLICTIKQHPLILSYLIGTPKELPTTIYETTINDDDKIANPSYENAFELLFDHMSKGCKQATIFLYNCYKHRWFNIKNTYKDKEELTKFTYVIYKTYFDIFLISNFKHIPFNEIISYLLKNVWNKNSTNYCFETPNGWENFRLDLCKSLQNSSFNKDIHGSINSFGTYKFFSFFKPFTIYTNNNLKKTNDKISYNNVMYQLGRRYYSKTSNNQDISKAIKYFNEVAKNPGSNDSYASEYIFRIYNELINANKLKDSNVPDYHELFMSQIIKNHDNSETPSLLMQLHHKTNNYNKILKIFYDINELTKNQTMTETVAKKLTIHITKEFYKTYYTEIDDFLQNIIPHDNFNDNKLHLSKTISKKLLENMHKKLPNYSKLFFDIAKISKYEKSINIALKALGYFLCIAGHKDKAYGIFIYLISTGYLRVLKFDNLIPNLVKLKYKDPKSMGLILFSQEIEKLNQKINNNNNNNMYINYITGILVEAKKNRDTLVTSIKDKIFKTSLGWGKNT